MSHVLVRENAVNVSVITEDKENFPAVSSPRIGRRHLTVPWRTF